MGMKWTIFAFGFGIYMALTIPAEWFLSSPETMVLPALAWMFGVAHWLDCKNQKANQITVAEARRSQL